MPSKPAQAIASPYCDQGYASFELCRVDRVVVCHSRASLVYLPVQRQPCLRCQEARFQPFGDLSVIKADRSCKRYTRGRPETDNVKCAQKLVSRLRVILRGKFACQCEDPRYVYVLRTACALARSQFDSRSVTDIETCQLRNHKSDL